MSKKKLPLRIVVQLVFFDQTPSVSFSIMAKRGEKIAHRIHASATWDGQLRDVFIPDWEELGWEIEAVRYKNGEWTGPKPYKWFNRFRKLMEKDDEEE